MDEHSSNSIGRQSAPGVSLISHRAAKGIEGTVSGSAHCGLLQFTKTAVHTWTIESWCRVEMAQT
jgi:hypothetical protein